MTAARRARAVALRAALALTFSVIAVEVALRVLDIKPKAPAGYPEGLYARPTAESGLGWSLASSFEGPMAGEPPVTIRTNAAGFRDAEFGPKSPGTLRIAALGDSFGFGHGVEAHDAYPDLIEARLAAEGRAVEVLNLGVPGYNTRQQLAQLRSLGPELAPDVVLLGCYVGNDLSGNLARRSPPPRPRFGVLVAAGEGEPDWRVTLRATLYRYSLIARNLRAWSNSRRLSAVRDSEGGAIGAVCETLDWDAGTALELYLREPTPDAEEATRLTEEALREAAFEAEELGARFAVALLPAPLSYDPRWIQLAQSACGLDPAAYDVERPHATLIAAGARDGYPVLDLLPAFRTRQTADLSAPLYMDVHFNAAGHALAAEEIAGFLLGGGFVEPRD